MLVRLINKYTFYATYIVIVQIRKVQEKEVKMDWIHLSGVDELKWIMYFNTDDFFNTGYDFFTNECMN